MKKIFKLLMIALCVLPTLLYSQYGALDCSFGKGGKLLLDYNTVDNKIRRIIKQSDGKILAVGTTYMGSSDAWVVIRYNANGSLDNTFATGGVFTYDFSTATYDRAVAVGIQTSGKIIVSGYGYGGSAEDFVALRLNTDGTLDNTFGTAGVAKFDFAQSTGIDYVNAMAIQADDKIILAGQASNTSFNNVGVVRLTASGLLDASFNTTGSLSFKFNDNPTYPATAYGVAIDGNSNIVLGCATNNGSRYDFAVARLTSSGAFDNTFGGDGQIVTNAVAGQSTYPYALKVLTDNSIVLAGYGLVSTEDFVIAKYLTSGALDNSFGTSGIVKTDFGSTADRAWDIEVQADNNLLVMGVAGTGNFAIARYSSLGVLDNTFGASGKLMIPVSGTPTNYCYDGVYVQSENKLIVGGYANNGTNNDFALAQVFLGIAPLSIGVQSVTPTCGGATGAIDLNVCGGTTSYSYNWTNSATTEDLINVVAGTYTVTVSDGSNTATASIVINSNTPPTVNISGPGSICVGESATLTGSGSGTSYSWSTTQTSTTIVVSPAINSTYTVTATSATGCTASIIKQIMVNALPVVSAGADAAYCQGSSTMLNASGATSYSWSPATGLDLTTGASVMASPVITTTYVVTGTDSNACSATDNVIVTAFGHFANAGADQQICNGSIANLNATGGTGYSWSGAGLSNNIISNPVATTGVTTTYYVTVTNASLCTDKDTVIVTVNAPPTVSISGPGSICSGQSASLTGTGSGVSYSWSTTQTSTIISVSPGVNTTYTVTSTDGIGCTASIIKQIIVNSAPAVTANNDGPACEGGFVNLIGGPGAMTNYAWAGSLAYTNPTQNPMLNAVTIGMAGTYTLTVTDGNGCTATASTNVIVNATPAPAVSGSTTICKGESTTLTVSGGSTYNWSSGGNTSIETLSPIVNTTYTVTAYNGSCSASTNVVVTVNNLPTATVSGAVPICSGASVSLTASGGSSYSWDNATTNAINTVSPVVNTTYTVTVTDVNGCKDTEMAPVTVNALPSPLVTSNSPICAGNTLNLSAGIASMTNYVWTGPSSFAPGNIENPMRVSATTAMSGVYTVTVTDVNGCTKTSTATIVVNALPTPIVTSNSPVCAGNTVNVSAGIAGMTNYAWSGPSAFAPGNIQNPTRVSATTAMSGIYTVTVTDANTCTNTSSVTVTVNALPTPSVTSNSPICAGTTLNLSAGLAGMNYAWSGPSAFAPGNMQNPTRVSATTAMSGVYTVTVTDANACTNTSSATITVNALPTPVVTSNSPVCEGTTLTISAGVPSMTNYVWTGPSSFAPGNIENPTRAAAVVAMSGAYTVTVTNAGGCTNTSSATITVNAIPTPSITGTNTICNGQSTTLTVSGASAYSWSTSELTTSITVSPLVNTTYTVTATTAGCSASQQVIVTVNPLPTPNVGSNSPICVGEDLNLTCDFYNSYNWSGPSGFTSLSQNPIKPGAFVADAGIYYVTVTNANGCTNQGSVNVTVNNPPAIPTLSSNSPVCEGSDLNLTCSVADSYTWSGPNSFASILQNPTITGAMSLHGGMYSVTVTDVNGCTNVNSITVAINNLPVVPSIGSNSPVCDGGDLNLSCDLAFAYSWTGPSFSSSQQNPTIMGITPIQAGMYTVTVVDVNGCTNSASLNVTVNNAPVSSITGTLTICSGQSTTLTATGAASIYSWDDASSISTRIVSPVVNTTYSVTITDAFGCKATSSAGVVVNVLPTPAINGTTGICLGGATTLTASGGATYSWDDASTSSMRVVSPGVNTTYTVTVFDASGCSASSSVGVFIYSNPIASISGLSSICNGDNTTLSAFGGDSYSWSTLSVLQNINIFPSVNTIYTVTVTDLNGCSASSQKTVTVNALPTASISGAGTICNGASVSLTGDGAGGGSYSWNTSQTSQFISVSPVVNSTYSLTVTDVMGCTDTEFAVVNLSPVLTATISGSSSVCANTNNTLTANPSGGTAPYMYNWSDGGGTAVVAGFVMATSQIYTVTVTDNAGCVALGTLSITVNTNPIANAGTDQSICNGSSGNLNATGGTTYVWSASPSLSNVNIANPVATPVVSSTYTVTVSDINLCTATDDVVVYVMSVPTVNADVDQTICSDNNNVLLNGSVLVAGGGIWVSSGSGSFSPNSTTLNATYMPSGADVSAGSVTLTLTSTSNGVCSAVSDDMLITITALPTVNITGVLSICNGNSTTLTASGASSYSWSTGALTDNVIVSPSVNATYTVTGTNGGCSASQQVVVSVNASPTVGVSNSNGLSLNCIIPSTTLTASGGTGYSWSNSVLVDSNPISVAGTYIVTVTDANGCTASTSATVTQDIASPTALISNSNGLVLNCTTNSTTLTATGGDNYEWSNSIFVASNSITTAGTYTVTVTNANGCTATSSVEVTQDVAAPTALISGVTTICMGESTTLVATGGVSYSWDDASASPSRLVQPSVNTEYTVTVTSVNGCSASSLVLVVVNAIPVANAGSDQTITVGNNVNLIASGGLSYSWNTGELTAGNTQTPTINSTYTVTVTTAGCSASDEVAVTVSVAVVANAGSDVSICAGSSTTLTASGGGSYVWNTLETVSEITVSPTITTTYTITVDNGGATATDEVVVVVYVAPIVSVDYQSNVTCNGGADGSIALLVSGMSPYSYNWSNAQTNSTATNLIAGTYQVIVTDINGCSGSTQAIITQPTQIALTMGSAQTICSGVSVPISVSASGGVGSYSYNWSPSSDLSSSVVSNPMATPLATTTYNVVATDIAGCTASDNVIITVNSSADAEAGSPVSICEGASTILTGTGGGSYSWSTSETSQVITVAPMTTTSYILTVDLGTGCTDEDTVVVTVYPVPVTNAGADQLVCSGVVVSLSSTGASTYSWSTGNLTDNTTVIPVGATIYTVTGTNALGCSSSDEVLITVETNTLANAGSDQTICVGSSVMLTATGGATYSWSTGEQLSLITVAPTVTTTYTVTANNASGCTSLDEVVVIVKPLPIANAGANKSMCKGSSVLLVASGGDTYQWSNSVYNDSTTVSPNVTQIFVVTVTNAGLCSTTDTVIVSVNALPTATINAANTTICVGSSTELSTSGGDTYVWNTTETTPSITVSPAVSTSYSLIATSVNGCTSSAAVNIVVNIASPVNAGADQMLCIGETASFVATGSTSYSWSTTQSLSAISVTPLVTSIYTVTGTDVNGCIATDEIKVTVNSMPVANAGLSQTICAGSSVTLSADGGTTYSWSTGSKLASISVTPLVVTEYIVTVSNGALCSAKDTVVVYVNALPSVNAGANQTICAGLTATLSVTGSAGNTYQWEDLSTVDIRVVSPTQTSTYIVTATDAKGCSTTDDVVITVQPIPIIVSSNDQVICYGSSVTLTAQGGDNYAWSNFVNTATNTVTPMINTIYTVTVFDINNCSATDEVVVQVMSLPVANAGADQTICAGAKATLVAQGTGTYSWSTGAQTASISVSPTATQNYIVTVGDGTCIAKDTVSVFVNDIKANYTLTVDTAKKTIATSNSSVNADTYFWDLGDGTTFNSIAVNHSYLNEGVYNVCLTVQNAKGCQSISCKQAKVGTGLVAAAFEYKIDTATKTVVLTDSSKGAVSSWFWDFGDGTTTNVQNPTHTYTSTGVYTVCLTVYNKLSGRMSNSCQSVIIGSNQVKSSYTFIVDGTAKSIVLSDASVGGNAWYWTFGDGTTSNQSSTMHTYAKTGVYDVCLTVRDTLTVKQSQSCKLMAVGMGLPVSSFIYYVNDTTRKVTCMDMSSGYINAWFWDFGDKTTSLVRNATHTYATAGVYEVCLTTMDTLTKNMSTKCNMVSVGVKNCDAGFAYFVDTLGKVNYTDASVGKITSWYWTFGDGGYAVAKDNVHSYTEDGKYKACLFVVEKSTGCVANTCKEILIGAEQPKAMFNYIVVDSLNKVYFTNQSQGDVDEWFWNFGDGTTSTQESPIHIYKTAGIYQVTLSVNNKVTEAKDLYSMVLYVGKTSCLADFDYSINPSTKTVSFIDKSSGTSLKYYWNFDDANYAVDKAPVHKYDLPGEYKVELTVAGSGGCMDKYLRKIQVGTINCNANYTYHIDSTSAQAHFKNANLGKSTNLYWQFGDGSFSTAHNPSHKYVAPGYYTVILNTYDSVSTCMDVFKTVLLIGSKGKDCQSDFIYQQDWSLNLVKFQVKTNSTFNTVKWSFGDKTETTLINPTHMYNRDDYYDVCLTINDTVGKCKNTHCKTIKIGDNVASCAARFIYTMDTVKRSVVFENRSVGNPTAMIWSFGDGVTNMTSNPEHVYANTGYYTVELIASNPATGCVSKYVEVVNLAGGKFGLHAGFGYTKDTSTNAKGVLPIEFKGASYGEASEVEWDFGDGTSSSSSMSPVHQYEDTGSYVVCLKVYDPIIQDSSKTCQTIKAETATGIKQIETIGDAGYKMQNYPNPFNQSTTVNIELPAESQTELTVFNITGVKLYTLVNDNLQAGKYSFNWDASGMQAGIYYVQLRVADKVYTSKIVKLK